MLCHLFRHWIDFLLISKDFKNNPWILLYLSMEQDNLGKFSRLEENALHARRLFMNKRAGVEGGSRWWDNHKEGSERAEEII